MTTNFLSERVPPGVNVPDEDMAMLGEQDAAREMVLERAERRDLRAPLLDERGVTGTERSDLRAPFP